VVDLLLAVLAVTVLGAIGLLALAGLTVVPFVLALLQADARGLSPGRVGGLAAAGVLVALALAGASLLAGAPVALGLPALSLAYAVPLLLKVLERPSFAGAAGRHE
jgi:hypothetical protein